MKKERSDLRPLSAPEFNPDLEPVSIAFSTAPPLTDQARKSLEESLVREVIGNREGSIIG